MQTGGFAIDPSIWWTDCFIGEQFFAASDSWMVGIWTSSGNPLKYRRNVA